MNNTTEQDNGLIVAMLFALVTDWDQAEERAGRRGAYKTTGASMYRVRELNAQETEVLSMIAGVLGMDANEADIPAIFGGEFEYQISYACNRFATRSAGSSPRLTSNELRTLERAKQILASKESEATRVLTTPERKAA